MARWYEKLFLLRYSIFTTTQHKKNFLLRKLKTFDENVGIEENRYYEKR